MATSKTEADSYYEALNEITNVVIVDRQRKKRNSRLEETPTTDGGAKAVPPVPHKVMTTVWCAKCRFYISKLTETKG